MQNDESADTQASDGQPQDDGGNLKQRVVIGAAALVAIVGAWLVGAAVLPRWWAQRIGDVIDGRLTLGSLLGLTLGFVFTAAGLFVLALGWRYRSSWRRAIVTVALAALVAAPNLLTLGIVMGDGNAAHAGQRILDVDGPGFRGGTLVGAIVGFLAAIGVWFLAGSRRRNKDKAQSLKAELESQ